MVGSRQVKRRSNFPSFHKVGTLNSCSSSDNEDSTKSIRRSSRLSFKRKLEEFYSKKCKSFQRLDDQPILTNEATPVHIEMENPAHKILFLQKLGLVPTTPQAVQTLSPDTLTNSHSENPDVVQVDLDQEIGDLDLEVMFCPLDFPEVYEEIMKRPFYPTANLHLVSSPTSKCSLPSCDINDVVDVVNKFDSGYESVVSEKSDESTSSSIIVPHRAQNHVAPHPIPENHPHHQHGCGQLSGTRKKIVRPRVRTVVKPKSVVSNFLVKQMPIQHNSPHHYNQKFVDHKTPTAEKSEDHVTAVIWMKPRDNFIYTENPVVKLEEVKRKLWASCHTVLTVID